MVADRTEFEAVAATMSIGQIADEALIGIIRLQDGRPLEELHREALQEFAYLLRAAAEMREPVVLSPSALRSMVALPALEETLRVVEEGSNASQVPTDAVERMTSILDAVLEGETPSDEDLERLRSLLDRLSTATLSMSELLAHPGAPRVGVT